MFVADKPQEFVPVTDHRAILGFVVPRLNRKDLQYNNLVPNVSQPRLCFPKQSGRKLFKFFEEMAEKCALDLALFDINVDDDLSWIRLYNRLTDIMTNMAKAVFGCCLPFKRKAGTCTLTSPCIQALVNKNSLIGGSLLLLHFPGTARVSITYLCTFRQYLTLATRLLSDSTTINALKTCRKHLARDLCSARAEEAY